MNIVTRPAVAAETRTSTKELPAEEAPAAGLRTQRRVLMLLGNAFDPDVRVHTEARSLVAAGYRVTILAWDRDAKAPRHEHVDGIKVERLRVRSTHGRGITQTWFAAQVTVAMIVRALHCKIDVVHAHDMDMLPAAYLISRLKRTPLVYDSHEDYAGMLQGSVPGWFANAIRGLESVLARRADWLITVGDILRAQFEARGCRRTVVVGNWKRLAEYEASNGIRDHVRSQLAIPPNAIVIAYIAQLGRDRKIVELLEAIRRRPQVHLIVGGAGVQRQAVVDAAAASANVHYLGIVKSEDVAKYTIAADAVYYGFDVTNPNARYSAPNKLFEALAAGRCVISGRFGEIQHIVAKYDCGVLVDDFSVEALVRALDACGDQNRLEQWKSNAARAGREQYSWEQAEVKLLEMYATLIGEPRHDQVAPARAARSKGRDR
jgi:glycosyltransferase involved in cell wall biosynthesis